MSDADFVDYMRSRVNPAYADMRGAESWERKRAIEILDRRGDEIARLQAQRDELLALLTEARKWQAEGEYGDPLPPDYWSPEYAAFMRKLDSAIANATKDHT